MFGRIGSAAAATTKAAAKALPLFALDCPWSQLLLCLFAIIFFRQLIRLTRIDLTTTITFVVLIRMSGLVLFP